MEWFNKNSGIISFASLLITILVVLGGLLLYFKDSGHVEGSIITNIQNLNDRMSNLENEYRLILTSLLNNNKAAIATINSSKFTPKEKQNLLRYLQNNTHQINQNFMKEKTHISMPKN